MANGRRHRTRFAPRFWIIVMVPAIALVGWRYSVRESRINEQEQFLVELSDTYYDVCMEGVGIRQQLEMVGTEEFIERTARREYSYMMPGEARFVVSNLPQEATASPQLQMAAPTVEQTLPASAQSTPNPDPLYVPEG